MKKLFACAAALSLLAFTSCKDDDDNAQDLLVGEWKLQSSSIVYGDGSNITDPANSCESQSKLIFSSNGDFTSNDYFSVGSICENSNTTGDYSYNDGTKVLTLNSTTGNETFSVTNLSSNSLVISQEGDFDLDGETDVESTTYVK